MINQQAYPMPPWSYGGVPTPPYIIFTGYTCVGTAPTRCVQMFWNVQIGKFKIVHSSHL